MIYFLYLAVFLIFVSVIVPAVLVGIGLPFKKSLGLRDFADNTVINHYDLPDWLKGLQNKEDGLTGDKRGWYWNTYFPAWVPAWFKMWWWSGVRNPWNYLKRHIIGINVKNYTITKLKGDDYVRDDFNNTGFQILVAESKSGNKIRPMLYWVMRWGGSNRAIVFQLGWKIKLSHNDIIDDKWVGLTFEPNPFKRID